MVRKMVYLLVGKAGSPAEQRAAFVHETGSKSGHVPELVRQAVFGTALAGMRYMRSQCLHLHHLMRSRIGVMLACVPGGMVCAVDGAVQA